MGKRTGRQPLSPSPPGGAASPIEAAGRGLDPSFDLGPFEALTFDCYGTLIDWEAGIVAAAGEILAAHGLVLAEEALLERYAAAEAALEAGSYRRYREVLAASLDAIGRDIGLALTSAELDRFADSVGDWPPFPDSVAALATLRGRFRLGVVTNCDDDLFARSNAHLGRPFEVVVTAQQVGAYKPSLRPFEVALARIGLPAERVLHVAQSLYHDHVPAKRLGLATVWVNRRHGRPGWGATPPAEAEADLVVPDLASLAALATAGT
ncbi:MAG TPA: haloacid dehalogenase type II [Candidatus Binatia bacterium]|nr:haloacid dehalogenase type II [Candidatus Binatia bacterium]